VDRIDKNRLPRHIAIIMDGNGRWAAKNTLDRISGHRRGAEAVRVTVETCREVGIEYLTLYAFSIENWRRPTGEVDALMRLLIRFLNQEKKILLKNDIRLCTIGQTDLLPPRVKEILIKTIDDTRHCNGMVLNLALSYGGRDDIVNAVNRIIEDIIDGRLLQQGITKELFSRYLSTSEWPDPDLLIRTSGEYRISNFLLWQSAFTEFYFTDVLWPDFGRGDLLNAIVDYQKRERRFGKTSEQLRKEKLL